MARISVGTRGWNGDCPATSVDEVDSGLGIDWVEVDGQRIKDVVSVRLEIVKGFASPVISVELLGPLTLTYLDEQGEPLPGAPVPIAGNQFANESVGYQRIEPD